MVCRTMRHVLIVSVAALLFLACGGSDTGSDGGTGAGGGSGGGAGGGTGGGSGSTTLPGGAVCGTVGPVLAVDGGSGFYDGGTVMDGGQLAWDATPMDGAFLELADNPGTRLQGTCPKGTTAGFRSVWGTGVYSKDSSICTAAVHAGVLNLATGGVITLEARPDPGAYIGTDRNCVPSLDYGAYTGSFVFIQ